MIYSIENLFALIDQPKDEDEFYHELSGNFGVDYYIDRITGFNPRGNRVLWGHWGEEPLEGLDRHEKVICTDEDEVILFLYIAHTEDFDVIRIENIDEALKFMYSKDGLRNQFWGDICMIRGNKRQKYHVKNAAGQMMIQDDLYRCRESNIDDVFEIELV